MCDPVTVGMSVLGGIAAKQVLTPKAASGAASAASQADPAAEQAAVEAKAANAANTKLAADQQRRRQQQSLLSRGAAPATGPTLGDLQSSGAASPLSGGGMNRSTAAQRTQSLMSRGAPQL